MAMTEEIQKYQSGLSKDKQAALCATFNPFMERVEALRGTAESVEVKTDDDVAAMQLARETRLQLKALRVGVEKKRKELKESSMREGKAIDGMANIVKFVIVPIEQDLQAKEDFVKRLEAERVAKMVDERTEQLTAYGVDCSVIGLADMTPEAFAEFATTAKLGHEAKVEAERKETARIEAERVAKEKEAAAEREQERVERERIEAENAKLRKQAEVEAKERAKAEAESKKQAEKEAAERKKVEGELRKKAEAAEAELRKQKEAEAKEQARIKAEHDAAERKRVADELAAKEKELARIAAEKAADEARKAAPDKDKLQVLVAAICALEMPTVESEKALAVMADVRVKLNEAVTLLRSATKEGK